MTYLIKNYIELTGDGVYCPRVRVESIELILMCPAVAPGGGRARLTRKKNNSRIRINFKGGNKKWHSHLRELMN